MLMLLKKSIVALLSVFLLFLNLSVNSISVVAQEYGPMIETKYTFDTFTRIDEGMSVRIIIPNEETYLFGTPQLRLGFAGAVLATVVGGGVTACIVNEWGTGNNPCSRVLGYLTKPIATQLGITNATNVKLKVFEQYHAGYIPGCQPMNSGPCNAGYWEIIFTKV